MLRHTQPALGSSHAASSNSSALLHHSHLLLLRRSNPWLCIANNRSCQALHHSELYKCSHRSPVQVACGKPSELSMQEATSSAAVSDAAQTDPQEALADRLHGCPVCNSAGRVPCKECDGRGFLKRGGYMKKNPLNMSRIIGSKWTAMEETMGWRHFRVIQQRKLDKHTPFLLLQASCDHSVQLWVNAQTLRDRSAWAAGWLQMSEVQGLGLDIQGSRGLKCQACTGLGYKPCVACEGTGRAQLIVL